MRVCLRLQLILLIFGLLQLRLRILQRLSLRVKLFLEFGDLLLRLAQFLLFLLYFEVFLLYLLLQVAHELLLRGELSLLLVCHLLELFV